MKAPLFWVGLALMAAGGSRGLAQSTPADASQHTANAASHAAQASGESAAASVAIAGSGLKLVSSVAAVPLWLSGQVVAASGEVAKDAAQGIWDLATSDSTSRPELDPSIGLPPAPAAKPAVPVDPSPAEALKRSR